MESLGERETLTGSCVSWIVSPTVESESRICSKSRTWYYTSVPAPGAWYCKTNTQQRPFISGCGSGTLTARLLHTLYTLPGTQSAASGNGQYTGVHGK
eukprot:1877769-Rhodomonas_salina.2